MHAEKKIKESITNVNSVHINHWASLLLVFWKLFSILKSKETKENTEKLFFVLKNNENKKNKEKLFFFLLPKTIRTKKTWKISLVPFLYSEKHRT